ncbi:MAG: hypothetical protein KAX19_04975, partial [Candidatus Brocadiae bacterium]|nr:hypothetical protein [Candidatus Brocadiia bacterium]
MARDPMIAGLAVTMALLVLVGRAQSAQEPTITNGGFERPYHDVGVDNRPLTHITGRIADGW